MDNRSIALARGRINIESRYDHQEAWRIGGYSSKPYLPFEDPRWVNIRRDWTPAQKRRMQKKLNRLTKKLGFPQRSIFSV